MEKQNNTPRLRFPGFTGEWVEKTLGEMTDICYGTRVVQAKDGGSIYPVYGGGGATFKMDTYNREDCVVISRFAMSQTCTRLVKGKFFLNDSGLTLNAHDELLQSYLDYYVISCNDAIYKAGEGMAQKNLAMPTFKALPIFYPKSKEEQEKIASVLMEADAMISAQEQKVEALSEKKKGFMQQLFPQDGETTPRFRFPGFTGEWTVKKLGDIAEKKNRRNSGLKVTRVFTNSANSGIVDQASYFDRDIAVKDNTGNYFVVELEDFIYNPRISTAAPVGPISINKIGQGIMSPLYTVFKFHTGFVPFFEQYFQTDIWHPYLKSIANFGARFDRMNITTEGFFNMPLFVPSFEEQQKIASCLSELDSLIKAETAKLEALKDHKKGLMQNLFPQPAK